MRFFTDNSGNFNWAAIGAICAVVGSILAVATFFMAGSKADSASYNIETVLGNKVTVGKIEGITLQQYEDGLLRREQEVVARLESDQISPADAQALRATLQQIDARQSDIQESYENVENLTAQIRAHQENSDNRELIEEAILDIFDGDLSSAATKALDAGIPLETVRTIQNTTSVFQQVLTKADFQEFVTEREIVISDNTSYYRIYGANGSIEGFSYGSRSGSGSWDWVDGRFCEEFNHRGKHYGQHCFPVFVSNSAVKFEYSADNIAIYTK